MDLPRLRRQIARFDPDVPVASARTPPASWYRDGDVLELEAHAVFGRHWLVACRADEVQAPGAFATMDILGESVVVVRGEDRTLRAFHNVCRHHAARLLEGCGRSERIVCPYHGWSYALDGALASAPHMAGAEDVDRRSWSLVPLAVESWGHYVFVHLGRPETSLAETLAPLADRLEAVDTSRLGFAARRVYRLDCNWKVFVDNYLDGGYHVGRVHPALAGNLELDGYRVEVFDRWSVQSCVGRGDARVGSGAQYAWIHPHLMLNRYGPILDANVVRPLGPDATEVVFDWFFEETEGPDARRFIDECLTASHAVQREDEGVCASVQRGLASSSYDTGRYAPRLEHGAWQFHRLLAADYAAGLAALAGDGEDDASEPGGRATTAGPREIR